MDIKLINQIISKIRNIYRYHPKYKNILKQKAIIDLSETDDGIILSSISFNDWDRITLSNTNVVYSCHTPAPRGSKTGTQGLKGSVERSIIPAELCNHIVDICEEQKQIIERIDKIE